MANLVSGNVSAYTISATTGALTAVIGSPFAAGDVPNSVTVSSDNQFVYTANLGSNNVSAYAIDARTGALTPLAGSPFAAGSNPASVATITLSTTSGVVPYVVGDTQSAATTAITGADLILGSVTRQASMTFIPGRVLSQTPVAGTIAARGSAVNLIVSTGSTCADLQLVKAAFGSKRGQPATGD